MTPVATGSTVEELSVEDGHRLFESAVRDALGIGRVEFMERLDRGEFDGTDSEDVIRLRMIAPFGRWFSCQDARRRRPLNLLLSL